MNKTWETYSANEITEKLISLSIDRLTADFEGKAIHVRWKRNSYESKFDISSRVSLITLSEIKI